MSLTNKQMAAIAVVAIAAVATLPFLGLTDFTTKGEPREAVVALSMLNDGNWILPVNNGGDIPYKPPFFHFCIAIASMLTGHVSEYTSRLPSALALIAMLWGCFAFFAKRRDTATALTAALLTLTSFEVHRAATVCRVDMMLTAFTVGAMLLLYRWREGGSRGVPVWAVLCMSGAVLTKGPVGFVLPCLVMGVFSLLRGDSFWRTLFSYALLAVLSCILPAVWYVAAWREGGNEFLRLVYEENIGRMTGTMSYDSHVHPFTYNFTSLLSGWAPWVLLLLFTLAARPWRRLRRGDKANREESARTAAASGLWAKGKAAVRRWLLAARQADGVRLFTWLAAALVFMFYCLPSSKRSVYLLPCYPFMAVLIADYIIWLWRTGRRRPLIAFVKFVAVLAAAVFAAFVLIRLGAVPQGNPYVRALATAGIGFWGWALVVLMLLSALNAVWLVGRKRLHHDALLMISALCVPVVMLFMAADGVFQPAVMNVKSLRPMAEMMEKRFGGEPVYSYIGSPMMHFFGANFYLGNRIGLFEPSGNTPSARQSVAQSPAKGVLMVPKADFADLARRHPDYSFTLVCTAPKGTSEVHGEVEFYRFTKKAQPQPSPSVRE